MKRKRFLPVKVAHDGAMGGSCGGTGGWGRGGGGEVGGGNGERQNPLLACFVTKRSVWAVCEWSSVRREESLDESALPQLSPSPSSSSSAASSSTCSPPSSLVIFFFFSLFFSLFFSFLFFVLCISLTVSE